MKIDLDESVQKLILVLEENEKLGENEALKTRKPNIRKNLKKFSQLDVQVNRRTCNKGKNYEKPWLQPKEIYKKCQEKTTNELGLPKDAVTLRGVNFCKKNVFAIKNSSPPKIKPRFVDRCFGDTQNVLPKCESRQSKKERAKPDEIPGTDSAENEEENSESLCRYVKKEEREELLHKMKLRWEEMMREFRTLPFVLDTAPLIRKKRNLEKDLSQLEKDIDTIERHPNILVYDDSKGFFPREKILRKCLKSGVL